jgi:hypothetical protein
LFTKDERKINMKTITIITYPALFALACFALSPQAQAVCQDGCDNSLFNAFQGEDALINNTTGSGNTALGWRSLFSNTDASFSTAVGVGALVLNDGTSNTAVGAAALLLNSTGINNTAVGTGAMVNNNGSNNNAFGVDALFANQSSFNNAFGGSALYSNETGAFNTAFGNEALSNNVSGAENTAVGDLALTGPTDGSFNTALGAMAGIEAGIGINNIYIGDMGVAGDNNVIAIGRSSASGTPYTDTYIGGIYETVVTDRPVYVAAGGHLGTLASSRRFKEEIKSMDKASEALFALKPVTFRYKQQIDPSHKLSFGLVAEDVAQVSPDLITRDEKGNPQTVRYDAVNAMLLNEFLKEHKTVQEQYARLTKQEALMAQQQKQIEALTTGLQKVSAQLELSKVAPQTVLNNQ